MRTPLLILTLGVGFFAGFAACFIDTPQPPSFFFDCGSDADCQDGEECVSGLCQVTCTFETFEDDCPSSDGYIACFNGVCAKSCSLSDDAPCTKPHDCVAFDLGGIDLGGLGGGLDPDDFGLCGEACDPDDPSTCAEGEFCFEGYCAPLGGSDGGDETGGDETGGGETGGGETGGTGG